VNAIPGGGAASPADVRFATWAAAHAGLRSARLGARLGGGNSNVTQLVEFDGGRAILRRPPDAAMSASAANGIRREQRLLKALLGRAPVPAALALCEDAEIIGQPFILTQFIPGVAITRHLPASYPANGGTLRRIGEELVDGLAAVHRVEWRTSGIESSAPFDYVPRQIERFVSARRAEAVRELPLLFRVADWLVAEMPRERPAALIHGDYHLDNTLFSEDAPRLAAIIDWELATVGDPLADVALMLAFWGPRPVAAPGFAFVQAVSRDHPTVSREELAARWSAATGIGVERLPYYLAFALWRLAAIVEGAYVLFRRGAVSDDYSRGLEHDVPALLAEAAAIAGLD
jgi:aminoglycoside phosphotransferase (APT) family kinase protein